MSSSTRFKDHLMASYLKHQQSSDCDSDNDNDDVGDSPEVPSNEELENFKNQVNIWIEYDNNISKLKQALKERRKAQDALTEKIGSFMSKYNIEDLNTKHGKIRCRVVEVKSPLTQKIIKERIMESFHENNDKEPHKVITNVFKRENTMQKIVLRRLGNNMALNIS